MEPEKKQELIIYGIFWGMLLVLVPAVMLVRGMSGWGSFRMEEVVDIWLGILPFLVLFLLHELLAAPLLVEKGKPLAYVGVMIGLMALFGLYVWMSRRPPVMPPPPFDGPPPSFDGPVPPVSGNRMPMAPEAMKLLLALLLMGVNLGVKYYLKSVRSERRLHELQRENLERQLESLRYQINPHFFMNTLNNIHALVDIDPEQAKESIEEFSKLMRFVLYEGNRPTIPLSMELEFLRHYVSLMKMRYADTVRIDLSLPETGEGAEIPPLVLASFVENAFKHGISYEKPSFVRVSVKVADGKVAFRCVNSRQGEDQVRSHGIGLQNVRGRLNLLYGDRYTLHIDPGDEVYDILLLLPMTTGQERRNA